MPVTEEEFESWCYRNGGETYDHDDWPGVAFRFPDEPTGAGVFYYPEAESFDVITEGRFFSTRSVHKETDARIDEDDRLIIDTENTRMIIDPR